MARRKVIAAGVGSEEASRLVDRLGHGDLSMVLGTERIEEGKGCWKEDGKQRVEKKGWLDIV